MGRRWLVGSHIDTVTDAGKYDGSLGVLAGIAAVEALHRAGEPLPVAVEVVAFGDDQSLELRFVLDRACVPGPCPAVGVGGYEGLPAAVPRYGCGEERYAQRDGVVVARDACEMNEAVMGRVLTMQEDEAEAPSPPGTCWTIVVSDSGVGIAPEKLPMERILGGQMGRFVQSLHEEHGVVFHLNDTAVSITQGQVTLKSDRALPVDFVVAGIGVRPRIDLAAKAGLLVERGVVVNAFLETSVTGVYAAGDIAQQATSVAEQRASSTMTQIGETLEQVAHAVHGASDNLRSEQPQLAGFGDTAADQVDRAAQFLREHDAREVIEGVQDFARRQPAVGIGAITVENATAVILAGGSGRRFWRASPTRPSRCPATS